MRSYKNRQFVHSLESLNAFIKATDFENVVVILSYPDSIKKMAKIVWLLIFAILALTQARYFEENNNFLTKLREKREVDLYNRHLKNIYESNLPVLTDNNQSRKKRQVDKGNTTKRPKQNRKTTKRLRWYF